MAQIVFYEWLVEEVDEHGDIQSVSHSDTAAEMFAAMRDEPGSGLHYEFGIVRDRFDRGGFGDLEDRQWAYVDDGVLPAEMDGGAKVPKRYADEFAKASA